MKSAHDPALLVAPRSRVTRGVKAAGPIPRYSRSGGRRPAPALLEAIAPDLALLEPVAPPVAPTPPLPHSAVQYAGASLAGKLSCELSSTMDGRGGWIRWAPEATLREIASAFSFPPSSWRMTYCRMPPWR